MTDIQCTVFACAFLRLLLEARWGIAKGLALWILGSSAFALLLARWLRTHDPGE